MEGVAGAHRVAHHHAAARHAHLAGAGEGGGALFPAGDHHQPGAEIEEQARRIGKAHAPAEGDVDVLVARLDDVGAAEEALRGLDPAVKVADHRRPQVGIDADDAPSGLPFGEGRVGGGHRLHRQGVGAEGEGAHLVRQDGRQAVRRQHAVGRAVAVEGVERLAVRLRGHHRDGGEAVGTHHEARVHPLAGQHVHEVGAEAVAGDAAEEGGRRAEPGKPHRHVEGRAAGHGARRHLVALGRAHQQVDEGFAADQDHGASPSGRITPLRRMMLP